jgi:CRISPR-associated endonuclease/helicase Cas3
VDLEHARLRTTMLPGTPATARRGPPNPRAAATPQNPNAALWWDLPPADALLTFAIPRYQPFRQDTVKRVDLFLRVRADDDDNFELTQMVVQGSRKPDLLASAEHLLVRLPDSQVQGVGIQPWGDTDYMQALGTLAEARDMNLPNCAERFGTVTLPDHEAGWRFHPALGFSKKKTA